MPNKITLIYPYYENPCMLIKQIEHWSHYIRDYWNYLRLIIVDDGSSKSPAMDILENHPIAKRTKITLAKVLVDIPWNQHGARNIGAHLALDGWLLLSDMDVVIPATAMQALLQQPFRKGYFHTFNRAIAPDFTHHKSHCNTLLIQREDYWRVNGYDEDYCGTYGGDGAFLTGLQRAGVHPIYHNDIVLFGYGRDVIPDANTDLPRKEGVYREKYLITRANKLARGATKSVDPLRQPYEVQLCVR